jgi:hypothetical protein
MADEMDQIRGTKFRYHSDSEGETEREEEECIVDDKEDVYVVAMDDEFKLQLCLGAVDTLSNTLAFQNWLTVIQSVPIPSSSSSSTSVRKLQRSWRVNDESHDFIIRWKKYRKPTSYTRPKYRTYEDEEQNSSSDDDDDSDEEAERVHDDPTVTVLEYFTVATQSNLSHTVRLDEDLLTWLPPSAPTSTREMVRKNMGLLLQADGLFNALSFTLMIAGAFVSSSRSTVSKTTAVTHTMTTASTSTTTTTPTRNTKRGYRRWAQLAIPVNERHDGFQYILVDTAPLEDLDCTLNSVVNATFAVAERVHVPDMITSVTTCLTRRGIPFEYKRAAQDDFGENDEPHPPSQRRRNSTGMIAPQKKKTILKEEESNQLILCRQGLVDNNTKKSGGASEADASTTTTPSLSTQFDFDPHGQLRDIGLAFG